MLLPHPLQWPPSERRIVLTLLCGGSGAPLSPFYGLARWIGVADFRGQLHRRFVRPGRGADDMTASILECAPRVVISGFVPDDACAELAAAGIDVRLGHCAEPAHALARRFESLPRAAIAHGVPELVAGATRRH